METLRPRNSALPDICLNFSGNRYICWGAGARLGSGDTMREAYLRWFANKEAGRL